MGGRLHILAIPCDNPLAVQIHNLTEPNIMVPPHIRVASDLVTPSDATTRGFVDQARSKVRRAAEYVEKARQLRAQLDQNQDFATLAEVSWLRNALLASIGLSDKAVTHLTGEQQLEILAASWADLQEVANGPLAEEIVFRFLLTSGDSLGGSMRNATGAVGKHIFAQAIVEALENSGMEMTITRPQGAARPSRIAWGHRLLVFDRKPKLVNKNIDVILLDTSDHGGDTKTLLEQKAAYVACGEVKGGIDPAGADEHWKTAHAALERIRGSFGLQRPALFFVGAAIATSMAQEILSQLRDNRLTYAANLTKSEQVQDLANWIISL
jgi:type II restriction enzyme